MVPKDGDTPYYHHLSTPGFSKPSSKTPCQRPTSRVVHIKISRSAALATMYKTEEIHSLCGAHVSSFRISSISTFGAIQLVGPLGSIEVQNSLSFQPFNTATRSRGAVESSTSADPLSKRPYWVQHHVVHPNAVSYHNKHKTFRPSQQSRHVRLERDVAKTTRSAIMTHKPDTRRGLPPRE